MLTFGLLETKLNDSEQNSTIIGTYCESLSDCSANQLCFNNSCQCEPNYKYEFINDSCEPFKCHSDEHCNEFDSLRKCIYDSCKCQQYYSIDTNTKFCNLTFGSSCGSSYECRQSGDSNLGCIFGKCQCRPNYNFTSEHLFCTYFECTIDDDCQPFNRKCSDGICVCDPGKVESILDYWCKYQYVGGIINISIVVYYLLGFILIMGSCISCCVCIDIYGRRKRRKLLRLRQNAIIQMTINNIMAENTQLNRHSPPPPYTRY